MRRIQLKTCDDPKTASKVASKIVKFTVENIEYLDFLCDGILQFKSLERFNRIHPDGHRAVDKWFNNVGMDKHSKINEFRDLFNLLYNTKSHEELSNRRGKVLELLVKMFVHPRYCRPGSIFSMGCSVSLNGRLLCTPRRKTVDICGWDWRSSRIELYETKVGPELFDCEVVEYLCYLKKQVSLTNISHIVGCVTMSSRDKLINQLKKVQTNHGLNYMNLKLFGRSEIINIKSINIAS